MEHRSTDKNPGGEVVVEMRDISKSFGGVAANSHVDLDIRRGEILSLLGENGSGKTTLMNMLSGIYYPDDGRIFVRGAEASIRSPKDAYDCRIGMVHQHFKLVDNFTAAENIVLGTSDGKKFDIGKVNEEVRRMSEKYGFEIHPRRKAYDMSVSEKQTTEIVKALYRGADILILDEPTAVLTPQEIVKLFDVLRRMREEGHAVVIITHKLNEVMEISDRVAVLRKGERVATVLTSETDEKKLTEMMVGKKTELTIRREIPVNPTVRLKVSELTIKSKEGGNAVDGISFELRGGEILGLAGISGNGQKELLEGIAGLLRIEKGSVVYFDPKKNGEKVNLRAKTPVQIRELGVRLSFVPEDRIGMGLVGNMDITDNMMLRSYRNGHTAFLDRKSPRSLAERIIKELDVVAPSAKTPVRMLSGGNVQKVLVGREIAASPTVMMAAYPVRGLDINSSYAIYNLLNRQKQEGVAVIFVGEDLDVLLDLCDRIMTIADGRVTGIVDARSATKEEIGMLMTGGERVGDGVSDRESPETIERPRPIDGARRKISAFFAKRREGMRNLFERARFALARAKNARAAKKQKKGDE